jgi:hypothetical protein
MSCSTAMGEVPLGQAIIVILFFAGWFFFANCWVSCFQRGFVFLIL